MAAAASTAHEAGAGSGAQFTPAEADLRGVEGGGLGDESPAARPSWVRRARATFEASVWAPVALKLFGLALGMVALAAVGAASILNGVGGVRVPAAALLGNDIHGAWLASKPASSTRAIPSAIPSAQVSAGTSAGAHAAGEPASSAERMSADTKTVVPLAPATSAAGGSASAGMTADGKVILNLASVEDLRHLPGVGAKRADAILVLRARLGRFKNVNDLLRVKGIGVRGLKKISAHVVLDAPKPSA